MAHRSTRAVRLSVCVVAVVFGASAAEAAKAKKKAKAPSACVSAYKRGVKLEETAQLIDARKAMGVCAQATCGAALRRECKVRFDHLKEEIPSVIPSVMDEKGGPVTGVEVSMDGAILTAELDGRAIDINPGIHEFSFSTAKGVIARQKVEISPRQHNRSITVSLGEPKSAQKNAPVAAAAPVASPAALEASAPEPAAAEQAPASDDPPGMLRSASSTEVKKGRGVAPYLLGVVGLAGVAGYGLFTYWGRKDNDALDQCSPNCPTEDIDHIRKLYFVADVSLGVGVVALAASTWLFIKRSNSSSQEEVAKTSTVHRRSTVVVDVKPAPSGAFATVSGAF